MFKTYVLRRDYSKISAVDPNLYGDRFHDFMRDEVLVDMLSMKSNKRTFVQDLRIDEPL